MAVSVHEQIDRYIRAQSPAKAEELRTLHRRILEIAPDARLWFLDGRNDDGKVVSNPNIGYGSETLAYADGPVRDLWRAAGEGDDHWLLHPLQIHKGPGSRRFR